MNYDNMTWEELAKYAELEAKTPLELALTENFKDLLESQIAPDQVDTELETIKEAIERIDSLIWKYQG